MSIAAHHTQPQPIPAAHSSWAVDFVRYAGQDFAVFCDSDDGGRIRLRPLIDRTSAHDFIVAADKEEARAWETPSACVIDNTLFIAWRQKDSDRLWVARTTSLKIWELLAVDTRIKNFTRPVMAALDGRLHLLWSAYEHKRWPDGLMYASLPPDTYRIDNYWPTGFDTRCSPSLTVYQGRLHAAWTGYHGGEPLFTATCVNGVWSEQQRLSDKIRSARGPGLAATPERLMLFFRQDDGELNASYSKDGTDWAVPENLPFDAWSDQDVIASSFYDCAAVGWNRNWTMNYALLSEAPLRYGLTDGAAVAQAGDPAVYVICGGAKFPIHDWNEFRALGYREDDIIRLPAGALESLGSVPADGSIFRELVVVLVSKMVGGGRLGVRDPQELGRVNLPIHRLVHLPVNATVGMPEVPKDGTAVLANLREGWGTPYVVCDGKLYLDEGGGPGRQSAPQSIFSVLPIGHRVGSPQVLGA